MVRATPKRVCFRGWTLISDENPMYLLYGSYASPSPWRPGSVGVGKPFQNTLLSWICQVVFSCNRATRDFQRTGDTVERLFQVILHRTLLVTRILWWALDLSIHPPTSTRQCYDPKRTHFHPFFLKFNIVWGGRGEVPSLISLGRSQHFWCPSLSF